MINEAAKTDCAEVIPRFVPEGQVPLVALEGTAYECGRQYGEIVQERYPGYMVYLDQAPLWRDLPCDVLKLFEDRAGFVLDIYRGLRDVMGDAPSQLGVVPQSQCSSFAVHGGLTLDGERITGQTKDTVAASARLYIVLRIRMTDGPSILVLAYPGEVLGYGMWSTGMSVFRNSVHSSAESDRGLTMEQWGLLALAGDTTEDAAELARQYGVSGSGNVLIADRNGDSSSVEFNVGGVEVIPARDGISVHTNHPLGTSTLPHEKFPDENRRDDSYIRCEQLESLLRAERGRLTAQKAMMILADHSCYPQGLCRHKMGTVDYCTTAAVVAEPASGKLHVTRGNPCCNWPTTYTLTP